MSIIITLSGNLVGTFDASTAGTYPINVSTIEPIDYTQIEMLGTQKLLGNPTLGTDVISSEISLGTSLYFKNAGTLAHIGLNGDIIVNEDGTTARFFGNTFPISETISSNQNDWNLDTGNVVKINSSEYVNITGISNGTDGQQLILQNIGTMPIKLCNQGTLSLEINRFNFAQNIFLDPNDALTIMYDGTSNNWRQTNKFANTDSEYYGSGKDGNYTQSSGVLTLTRDMYYQNLTITGGTIYTNGWKIYVSEMLDISNAPSNSITFIEPNIINSTINPYYVGYANGNTVGGGGPGLDTGTTGDQSNGRNGGLGGGCVGTQNNPFPIYRFAGDLYLGILGGCGGAESTKGPSGSGGGCIWISARYINRGINSHSGIILNPGGNGYNAGGGGWTYIAYGQLLGNTISNALSCPGGNTIGPAGGLHGIGGRITQINLTTNTASETIGSSQSCFMDL